MLVALRAPPPKAVRPRPYLDGAVIGADGHCIRMNRNGADGTRGDDRPRAVGSEHLDALAYHSGEPSFGRNIEGRGSRLEVDALRGRRGIERAPLHTAGGDQPYITVLRRVHRGHASVRRSQHAFRLAGRHRPRDDGTICGRRDKPSRVRRKIDRTNQRARVEHADLLKRPGVVQHDGAFSEDRREPCAVLRNRNVVSVRGQLPLPPQMRRRHLPV